MRFETHLSDNVRGAMNCATTNGMKSGAEIILSNLNREGVNDAGGLDAEVDDARNCCDEVARVSEPTVWVVDDAAVWVGLDLVAVNEPLQR